MASKPPVKPGEPSWFWRRILLYSLISFACFELHRMVDSPDTRVNETIAWGWVLTIISIALGYTGLATAQDITAIMTTRTAKPYSDPPQEPTPPPPADNQTVIVQQQVPTGPGMPEPK